MFGAVAVAPLFLYACGVLKDGEDRADLPGGDDTRDAAVDSRDGANASSDAHDTHDTGNAHDASDAPSDALDAGNLPPAKPIALAMGSSTFFVDGFTSDGWLAYSDPKSVKVVPLTGGNSVIIVADAADASDSVHAKVDGKVVSASIGDTASARTVWSHATGLHTIPGRVADLVVSNDGSRIAYDVGETTADGSVNVYTMESDLDLANPIRLPGSRSIFSFLAATGDHFVVETRSTPDPNDYTFSVDSFTNAGVQTQLFQNADTTIIQVTGGAVVLYEAPGRLLRRSVSGGPTTTYELPADAGTIDPYYVLATRDGSRVAFGDKTRAFWSSPTTSPNVTPIPGMVLPSTFNASSTYLGLAPNGSHFVAYSGATAMIAPTAAGNAITVPAPSGISRFAYTPTFSGDSRYLYTSYSVLFNELNAVAVDTGVATRVTLDVDCDAACWQPAHGAKVLYVSKGSLYAGDADNPGNPIKLADSVGRFWPSPDGTVVAYQYKDPNSEAASGLFVIGVP